MDEASGCGGLSSKRGREARTGGVVGELERQAEPVNTVPDLHHRELLTPEQVRRLGHPDPRPSRGGGSEWTRVLRGCHIQRRRWEELTERQKCLGVHLAYLARARTPFVFSHTSAALFRDLSLLHLPDAVHISAEQRIACADPRVRVHRAPGILEHRRLLELRLPVTDAERTLLDCATGLPFDDAVVIADQILKGDVSRRDVLSLLDEGPRRRGSVTARRVFAFADARSESVLESLGRIRLQRMAVPMPQPQVLVRTHRGRKYLDFGWPHLRFGLELDGKAKYFRDGDAAEAIYQERQRQLAIEEAGWVILRANWADVVGHPEQLEMRLVQALEQRARQLGVPVFPPPMLAGL